MPYVNVSETGLKLKTLLKSKGMKVKDLQDVFGFANPQAIYNWMSGKTMPSVDNLVVLSVVLDTKLDDLLVIDNVQFLGVSYNGIMSGSNPEDVGSIPTAPVYDDVAKWLKSAGCNPVIVSSNLTVIFVS